MFAGSGFGANGALIWSRYFYDEIVLSSGKNKRFSLILDAIPYSYPSMKSKSNVYENSLQNMLKIANVDEVNPFILCTLRNEGEEWRCFKLDETYYYLNFPVFWIDSQYDRITVEKALEIDCVSKTNGSLSQCSDAQRIYLDQYRSAKIVQMYAFINFHGNSAWTIGCSTDSFLNSDKYNNDAWSVNGKLMDSVHTFTSGRQTRDFDNLPWPSNNGCSGQS